MSDEQKPASEWDVQFAIRGAINAADDSHAASIAALTAARGLGCLLPEEAAALRVKLAMSTEAEQVFARAQQAAFAQRDALAGQVAASEAKLLSMIEARDAAKAEMAKMREALREIAERSWSSAYADEAADNMREDARAALTEARPDEVV